MAYVITSLCSKNGACIGFAHVMRFIQNRQIQPTRRVMPPFHSYISIQPFPPVTTVRPVLRPVPTRLFFLSLMCRRIMRGPWRQMPPTSLTSEKRPLGCRLFGYKGRVFPNLFRQPRSGDFPQISPNHGIRLAKAEPFLLSRAQ